jgi:phosphatidylglycerophosphate synthase
MVQFTASVGRPESTRAGWQYEDTLKDPAVEEFVNRAFHRRVAFQLLRPLEGLQRRPTPNQITLVSGALGVVAGLLAYTSVSAGPLYMALSALFLFVSVVFDCGDGMLARLTGQKSEFGELLDGSMDFVVAISFGLGMGYALTQFTGGEYTWLLVASIFPSMIIHCAAYDHLRRRFELLVDPRKEGVQSVKDVKAPNGFLASTLALYTAISNGTASLISGPGDHRVRPAVSALRAREIMTAPMQKAGWLGLGTHFFLLYTATFFGALRPDLPIYALAFVIAGALNLWMVHVARSWRRAERELLADAQS